MGRVAADDDVFRAVADATRRRIVDRLADGAASVTTLVEATELSQSAVSQHLAVLRRVGLVHAHRDGRHRIYHLDPAPLAEVHRWVTRYERFWDARLERLGRWLDDDPDDGDRGDDAPKEDRP